MLTLNPLKKDMEYKDYYKMMGLSANASQEEIRRVYRKLARKYHPDVSKEKDAEHQFKALGEAYEVLKDPRKRAEYDNYRLHMQSENKRQEETTRNTSHSHYPPDFEEFIQSILKDRKKTRAPKAQDTHTTLSIRLEESFHGTEKRLELQPPEEDAFGYSSYNTRTVKVKIPPGITDKQQIRLKGKPGEGNLYIEIHILPHAFYTLKNKDIYLKVPISPWEAALGLAIKVPTLAGDIKVTIPKLSQSGNTLRIKGKGLPGNPPGDQHLLLDIVIPQQENAIATKLYEELAHTLPFNPRAHLC